MTALHRDLSAPEIWQRSFERSRRRRAVTPKLRRQAVRRKGASTAMAAAMLAGPGAQFAGAQTTREGPGSGSGSSGSGIASDSPANRAIAGGNRAAEVMLSRGSAGEAVKAVQAELGVEVDGVFDKETEGAVVSFQASVGLAADGIVGPLTWAALFGGSGTGQVANTGNSAPVLVPATGAGEQRTSFAVRRAADDELEKLNVEGADLPKPKDESAGLAAIEFRLPDEEGSEDSSDEPRSTEGSRDQSVSLSARSVESTSEESSDEPRSTEGSRDQSVSLSARSVESTSEEDSGSGSSVNSDSSGDPDRSVSNGGSRDSGAQSEEGSGSESDSGNAGSDSGEGRDESKGGECSDTLKWPTTGRNITSPYGDGRNHGGVDIDGGLDDEGNPVYAAACGVISLLSGGHNGGYGNLACVRHTDRFVTCYAHLSGFANVREGDYVRRGQTIGYVGNTPGPPYSRGAHLHFEVRNGTPYRDSGWPDTEDPMPYLEGRQIPGEPVRASSRDTGGPREEQAKQAWTAQSEPATEERSAVAIATDSDESTSEASSERRAPADRYAAAESEPVEPTAEKPAPEASEPEAGEREATKESPAGGEAGDEAQMVATEEEQTPVEETTFEEPAPAPDEPSGTGEAPVPREEGEPATEGDAESSTPSSEGTGSNDSDPSTGGVAEEPSAGGDGATTDPSTSAGGGTSSAGSVGDAGSGASADGSASVASGTTATGEAPPSTAATGSGSASGSGQAETSTATAPSESAPASTNGSTGAAPSGGSEATTATGESTGGAASSDASTAAYFSEDESEQSEPGAGD